MRSTYTGAALQHRLFSASVVIRRCMNNEFNELGREASVAAGHAQDEEYAAPPPVDRQRLLPVFRMNRHFSSGFSSWDEHIEQVARFLAPSQDRWKHVCYHHATLSVLNCVR